MTAKEYLLRLSTLPSGYTAREHMMVAVRPDVVYKDGVQTRIINGCSPLSGNVSPSRAQSNMQRQAPSGNFSSYGISGDSISINVQGDII